MRRTRLTSLGLLLVVLVLSLFALPDLGDATFAAERAPERLLWVDADPGADDAAAIVALWRSPNVQIVGFSTVYGNATLENATRNLLTLQAAAGHSEPVVMGASTPLVRSRPHTGAFIHGPDGFWFQQQPRDLSAIPSNAPDALAAAARAHAGQPFAILALGPITNIANAVTAHPDAFVNTSIIWLGSAKNGGNITPVAEANSYADPEAVTRVLASPAKLTIVPLDAFGSVTYDAAKVLDGLQKRKDSASLLLAKLLAPYWQATSSADGGATLPDAVAAAYAARPSIAEPTSALVQVIASDDVTRGMTIMAVDLSGRVSLNAQPNELDNLADRAFDPTFNLQAAIGAILMRKADNAQVVLTVNARRVSQQVQQALLKN